MNELHFTDTNSADDSSGRVFGLDGNLYLPVVLGVIGSLGLVAVLGLLVGTGWFIAGVAGAVPLAAILGWALLLKHNKPAGYDRDRIEQWLGGAHFTLNPAEQQNLTDTEAAEA
ncbi:MAG: hypothetical protein LBK99_13670 [Opitutaceae bacterium]|jgi:hypothetical protein|nr:hypothetical protein [Opitutaceae bacterium]